MGTSIVKDGKITRWTDYWDTGLIGQDDVRRGHLRASTY